MKLLSVIPDAQTRPYFDVEPGGFGVPGISDAEQLRARFPPFAAGMDLPKRRVITSFDSTGPVFRAAQ